MRLGVIADDFTGASDVGGVLASRGLAVTLFNGTPPAGTDWTGDVAVVSLKIRSTDPASAAGQSLAAASWLLGQGCDTLFYKVCSTFDSTPQGNIGTVAAALASRLGASSVPVCPAYPVNGRTVFKGHLFVGDRLLNESGMENHPLCPMTDANIRRWLSLQTNLPVELVALDLVRAGAGPLADALASQPGRTRLIIVDATSEQDLSVIAQASLDCPLLIGASGLAAGVADVWPGRGQHVTTSLDVRPEGRTAILAGSCSNATRRQIERYRRAAPAFELDVARVLDGTFDAQAFARDLLAVNAAAPLAYSSGKADRVPASPEVGSAIERAFAEVAISLVAGGVTQLIVAGGETSGAVVEALAPERMEVGQEIAPGVPQLSTPCPKPMRLVLKSGNFGDDDFFAQAVAAVTC